MAINPNLLVIKPVNELESVTGLQAGQILFYDGSNNLKKIDVDTFNNLSKTAKPLKPTDSTPTQEGLYMPTESGTYNNADGLVAQEGYYTLFFFDGTNWTKSETKLPENTVKIPIWSATDFAINAQSIKDNFIYIAPNGADATDIPGESDKWVSLGVNKRVDDVLQSFLQDAGEVWEELDIKQLAYNDNSFINQSFGVTDSNSYNSGGFDLAYLQSKGYTKIKVVGDFNDAAVVWLCGVDNTNAVYDKKVSGIQPNNEYIIDIQSVYEFYGVSELKGNTKFYGNGNNDFGFEPDGVKKYIDEKIKNQPNNGTLKNISNFKVSDFTSTSSNAVNNGVLNLSSAGITNFNYATLHEDAELSFIYKENQVSNTIIGFKSQNPDNKYSFFARFNTSGANLGKIDLLSDNFTNIGQSSENNTNYAIGDILKISLFRNKLKYSIQLFNLTKGWSIQYDFQCVPNAGAVAHNQSKPSIQITSGNINIYNFRFDSFSENVDMVIGDSITMGSVSTSQNNRYAGLINGNVLVSGGGSDTTQSVINRLDEILLIKPNIVYSNIGGNDILVNVPPATWQNNLKEIRNTLVNAGIQFVWLFTTPRSGANQINNFIKSEPAFATDLKIDINTPLRSGTNSEVMNPMYLSLDDIHPNDLGHAKIAETINSVMRKSEKLDNSTDSEVLDFFVNPYDIEWTKLTFPTPGDTELQNKFCNTSSFGIYDSVDHNVGYLRKDFLKDYDLIKMSGGMDTIGGQGNWLWLQDLQPTQKFESVLRGIFTTEQTVEIDHDWQGYGYTRHKTLTKMWVGKKVPKTPEKDSVKKYIDAQNRTMKDKIVNGDKPQLINGFTGFSGEATVLKFKGKTFLYCTEGWLNEYITVHDYNVSTNTVSNQSIVANASTTGITGGQTFKCSCFFVANQKVYMVCSVWNLSTNLNYCLMMESVDGRNFTMVSTNIADAASGFKPYLYGNHWICPEKINGYYYWFIEGTNANQIWEMKLMKSQNITSGWELVGNIEGLNPFNGAKGGPCVYFADGKFKMVYHYAPIASNLPTYLAFAESNIEDPLFFTPLVMPLLEITYKPYPLTDQVADPELFEIDGKMYLICTIVDNTNGIAHLHRWDGYGRLYEALQSRI